MPEMTCPKCGSPMTTGFLLERDQGSRTSEWVEGAPEKSIWGLKLKGRRRFQVNADRCERCGFLELYA
jgi:hypothetical protein